MRSAPAHRITACLGGGKGLLPLAPHPHPRSGIQPALSKPPISYPVNDYGSIKLFTKLLRPTVDGETARIWIEGHRLSLEYLGKLILAQAVFPLDCKFGISPRSGGSAFFKKGAKVGIVIHRLPCMSPKMKTKSARRARSI
jgi:hypothetical protein